MADPVVLPKSAAVRIWVMVAERGGQNEDGSPFTYPGYWAAGRFFPNGESEVVLEDKDLDPLTVHDFATGQAREVARVLTVAQQLRQLDHAKGGQIMGYEQNEKGESDKSRPRKSPAMLSYRILDDGRNQVKK